MTESVCGRCCRHRSLSIQDFRSFSLVLCTCCSSQPLSSHSRRTSPTPSLASQRCVGRRTSCAGILCNSLHTVVVPLVMQVTGFVQLLRTEPLVVAIAWANLLALDYCLAREVFIEGQQLNIPTRHSLVSFDRARNLESIHLRWVDKVSGRHRQYRMYNHDCNA